MWALWLLSQEAPLVTGHSINPLIPSSTGAETEKQSPGLAMLAPTADYFIPPHCRNPLPPPPVVETQNEEGKAP